MSDGSCEIVIKRTNSTTVFKDNTQETNNTYSVITKGLKTVCVYFSCLIYIHCCLEL